MVYVTDVKYPAATKIPLIALFHTIWNGNIQFLPPKIPILFLKGYRQIICFSSPPDKRRTIPTWKTYFLDVL